VSIDLPWDKIIGWLLMVGGGGWLASSKGRAIWKWFRSSTASTVDDAGHNSDIVPPEGFCDHINLIQSAAPSAPAEVILGYCLAKKTEAGVLLAERDRLQELVGGLPKEVARD